MIDRVIWVRDKIAGLSFIELSWIFIGIMILPCLLFICGIVANNTFRTPPEPVIVNITTLILCRDWKKDELPLNLPSPVSPDIEKIFVCGRLHSNRTPLTIRVNWYYEGSNLHQDIIHDVKDEFSSDLIPSDNKNFQEGNYEVKVFASRELLGHLKFEVENIGEK